MAARLQTLARHLARRAALTPTGALRASARTQSALPRLTSTPTAGYATSGTTNNNSPFASQPSPLRLPPDEQAEFERLQRAAGTQEPLDPAAADEEAAARAINPDPAVASPVAAEGLRNEGTLPDAAAAGDGADTLLPLRRGAPPEFEGDVNPRTGEVGGPKNEPLRWGAGGDWSYNGRVTDF